ncbi:putative GNAT family acetyltransferase [Rosellinia necatrix]|uniref:Putative GNAT family acetyltransferase n=1 Tax=Rosellinia necatrix TaxID=77044 RepID=A0A1W2TTI6_ROSNE|nr:putative GNAT family acetyltransferase [Rosellinia necatrix]
MPLKLYPAVPADAGRIADIHMAAFSSNAMLLAQFPTPVVREGLRESIRKKALADIDDPKITVLVVRETAPDCDPSRPGDDAGRDLAEHQPREGKVEAGKVIAFAKWSHPVKKGEEYEEAAWIWPPGTNMSVLESWGRATEEAQEEAMGGQPCYRKFSRTQDRHYSYYALLKYSFRAYLGLTFMGTDPPYERQGAASMMVRWGLEECQKNSVPGYLESTLNAAALYEKMGFVMFRKISLRYYLSNDRSQDEVYEEIAFMYHPDSS